MKTIAIFLTEESIDVAIDALRARQNEMYDQMNYNEVEHGKIENLKELLCKAKEKLS